MKIKKGGLILLLLAFSFIIPAVSAQVQIQKTAVIDSVIPEFNNPAIVDFKITNLGETDIFKMYSLVGVDFFPNESFSITKGATKEIRVEIIPQSQLLTKTSTLNFVYKIEGKNTGITEDVIAIKVVKLKDALEINSYTINLDSQNAMVYAKNLVGYDFPEITANIQSAFFNFGKTFTLGKYEKKEFEIPLNSVEMKKLVAGDYLTSSQIQVSGIAEELASWFKFTEKANIETTDNNYGILIRSQVIEKTNAGNIPSVVQVKITKNILSRLFTTFNIEPSSSSRQGAKIYYTFQKEIMPAEVYTIKATTNWLYPLIVILALFFIGYLIRIYTATDIVVKKRSSFIKAKGGEFALKVTLTVKAKNYTENIRLIDKLPPMVKVYPKFPVHPSRVDETNRRIEWNIPVLQQYEERTFSYVIYSKVGIVGRFELPPALAVYDSMGKIHEVESNKVFFMTDVPKRDKLNF